MPRRLAGQQKMLTARRKVFGIKTWHRSLRSPGGQNGQPVVFFPFLKDPEAPLCQRRTDLIRFGRYTSGYQWQWKGGVQEGCDVDPKYAYLPIPEAELSANPELQTANAELGY